MTLHGMSLRVTTVALLVWVAGCAIVPRAPPVLEALDEPGTQCVELLERVDATVARAGVGDALATRVAGFPHVRVNRFLASYARDTLDETRFGEWARRMHALGSEAYAVELANLPSAHAAQLVQEMQDAGLRYVALRPAVMACSNRLAAADLASPDRRASLREAVRVPDDYVDWQRVVGLYWLTRIPFADGVQRWRDEVRRMFAQPVHALPVAGRLKRYAAPRRAFSRTEVADILRRSSNNALAIPDPQPSDLEALFEAFAPDFEIDTAGEADQPGELVWRGNSAPDVDTRRAVVYHRVSHTRYREHVLLQLNYTIWFPERPEEPGWDLLGGHLDGLIWRVTLAPDGAPWVFDSIHPCGCYHEFFPTARAVLNKIPASLDETAFVPQGLQRVEAGARVVLRVASGTHYLQRVIVQADTAPDATTYIFMDDDALRSLPLPTGGHRSAFRADGIVAGTERAERYLFWPMGVPEPGAMRQWGRHATAFVGRRHFDDADLFERYFEMRSP